jgi:hypothetical protein
MSKYIQYPLTIREESSIDIVDADGKLTATVYLALSEDGKQLLKDSLPGSAALAKKMAAAQELYEALKKAFSGKPTVSLGVTCAVVDTYGCDNGRIAPTRCAIIAAGLDGK